jgi:MFS family permease
MFFFLGFFIPFNYLPAYAKGVGLTPGQQALLISMIGIANTVSRLTVGFISDKPWADCLLINNIALIVAGGTTIIVPFVGDYGILILYSILFGTGIGKYIVIFYECFYILTMHS